MTEKICSEMCSALNPGQSGESPASHRVAVAVRVFIAFESLEDVVGVRVAGLRSGLGRVMRPRAGAAQEHHRGIVLFNLRLQLGQKSGIALTAGEGVPFYEHRIGNAPDI